MKRNKNMLRKDKTMVQTVDSIDEQPRALSWSPQLINVRVKVTGLEEPLLRFAILKDDPVPAFEVLLETYEQQNQTPQDELTEIAAAWNKPFLSLTGEQLFFLWVWSSIAGSSPRVVVSAGLVCLVATPGSQYKRWLVTRPLLYDDKLVAWCEEIDMQGSTQIKEIVLTEENMLVLAVQQTFSGTRVT
jgi:hypothetical protein